MARVFAIRFDSSTRSAPGVYALQLYLLLLLLSRRIAFHLSLTSFSSCLTYMRNEMDVLRWADRRLIEMSCSNLNRIHKNFSFRHQNSSDFTSNYTRLMQLRNIIELN